jgi:hypothetical protein
MCCGAQPDRHLGHRAHDYWSTHAVTGGAGFQTGIHDCLLVQKVDQDPGVDEVGAVLRVCASGITLLRISG